MQLAAIMARRAVPGAGLLISLTARCPLHCAHCSTASGPAGPQPSAAQLRRFVSGFGPDDRPDVMFLTGGEPMLRPDLVAELAASARTAGTATAVLTGGFFAGRHGSDRGRIPDRIPGRIPDRIRTALLAVDHVSLSLDVFHEAEVGRSAVFAVLAELLRLGRAVSLHVVGSGPSDPYLAEVTRQVRERFGSEVPMLVSSVQPVGRAAAWWAGSTAVSAPDSMDPAADSVVVSTASAPDAGRPSGCALAAWPVVAADGVITACCNTEVSEDRPVPGHLRLGDVADDSWVAVRRRLLDSAMLRAIRVTGPDLLRAQLLDGGCGTASGPDSCAGCRALADGGRLNPAGRAMFEGAGGAWIDELTAQRSRQGGPERLLRRYAVPRYAHLVSPR